MSAPEAELLLKHAVFPPGSGLLVVGVPDRATASALADQTTDCPVTLLLDDYARWRDMKESGTGMTVRFGTDIGEAERFGSAAVFLPRERELAEVVLLSVARAVLPDGPVWLVGSIRSGAKSLRPTVERTIGPVERSYAGRHCVLFQAARNAVQPASGATKSCACPASPDMAPVDRAKEFSFPYAGREVKAVSLPGVFSHGRLDAGSRFLLDTMEKHANIGSSGAQILDFGCGAGVIGAALGLARPDAKIALVDASARAIASARRTLAANGLSPDAAGPSDVFSDVPGRYDLIVSNPPFHAGAGTDYRAVDTFIREAPARLNHGGRLRLVANRFLKYPPLLKTAFGEFLTIASDSRYAVYEAVRR
jgi:16S rRNA (guanine1207-N2)-methyltransferase